VTDAPAPAVAEPADAGPAAAPPTPRRPGRRWAAGLAWAGAALLVFAVYLRVSQTEPGDSYGAVFTLQAWDMLHGNLLLHGWWLSDVSFYTTELPEYLLVELALGHSPDVVHVAAASTFTIILLLAVLLARGRSTGRAAVVRMAVAAGIMCSPQPGAGVFLFLLAPDHYGSTVPVLLAWLILDRAARRWYVPVAVGVLLGWALVADSVLLLTGVLPLLTVCAVRLYHRAVQQRQPLRAQWFEAALLAAGLLATAAAATVLHLIGAAGGFRLNPVSSQLTSLGALPGHMYQTVAGLALVFGGDFFGQPAGPGTLLVLLHLAGLALAVWAAGAGLRRLRDAGLVNQLLLAGILVNLAAFGVWTDVTSLSTVREIVAVLPFGAVLAARLLADRLAAARLLPVLAKVGGGYRRHVRRAARRAPVAPGGRPADGVRATGPDLPRWPLHRAGLATREPAAPPVSANGAPPVANGTHQVVALSILVVGRRHNGGHGTTHRDTPAPRGLRGKHRRHRCCRGDAGQLPGVRLLRYLPARAAGRPGRAEAGAAPDPVPDERDGAATGPRARQVRPGGR
jgi:hypothetical protein